MTRRNLIKIGVALLIILALAYLYLVKAVNKHQEEFGKMKKGSPDSIKINDTVYHFKNDTTH